MTGDAIEERNAIEAERREWNRAKAKTVECYECGKKDRRQNMIYQGKDGPENTAPSSAFDYYLCSDCEGFYKRSEAIEDDESDDAVPCRSCGLLFHRGTFVCPVCFTERF